MLACQVLRRPCEKPGRNPRGASRIDPAAARATPRAQREDPSMNLFTDIRALVINQLEAMTEAGQLPAGLDLSNVAVEPPRDAAHGDMATNAAMVLAKPAAHETARDRGCAGGPAGRRCADRQRRGRGAGVPEPAAGAGGCGSGVVEAALAEGDAFGRSDMGRGRGSTSNMSRPTRPDRCMWAIPGARCSATRWRR